MQQRKYCTTVITSNPHDDLTTTNDYMIDLATAERIVRLSMLVAANGLQKVTHFDGRAGHYECLNVSESEFWFSACIKHTDVEVKAGRQCISDLADFYELKMDRGPFPVIQNEATQLQQRLLDSEEHAVESAVPQVAEDAAALIGNLAAALRYSDSTNAFVQMVSDFRIWDWDKNDGTAFDECDEPADGHIDSHVCLMQLIERARCLVSLPTVTGLSDRALGYHHNVLHSIVGGGVH